MTALAMTTFTPLLLRDRNYVLTFYTHVDMVSVLKHGENDVLGANIN